MSRWIAGTCKRCRTKLTLPR
uniref:Uncharacterized protein n=1 Tax=Rhizophora mucronata TaxID=61149 RepID=A0A2P2NA46_RHIMU